MTVQVLRRHAPVAARLRGPLLTAGLALAGTLALHLRDPHEDGSWGVCPTKLLSGLDCPGCGGLRAVNSLGNGEVVAAVSSNALLVLAMPALVVMWGFWARRRWQGRTWQPRPATTAWAYAALAVTLGFTVARNLPGSWLAS